jgi:ribonuclease HI
VDTPVETLTAFDALIAAAHHSERVLSRRLARSAGLDEHAALTATLTTIATAQGLRDLPHLLALRAEARLAEQIRRAANAQHKGANRALKKARQAPEAGAWLAWFDGSAHPNPGQIGIGALITGPAGQLFEISRRAGYGNSSEAEYLALIALLEASVALQPASLVIHGDSLVVINDVRQLSAVGAKGLHSLRARAVELMARIAHVELRWIPRHKNGAADKLSQQAVSVGDDTQ